MILRKKSWMFLIFGKKYITQKESYTRSYIRNLLKLKGDNKANKTRVNGDVWGVFEFYIKCYETIKTRGGFNDN